MKKKLNDAILDGNKYEVEQVQAESKTKLEDDKGVGREIVLRFFEYTANPDVFKSNIPSGQTLFNAHHKEMEISLWRDGLVPEPRIEPRLLFSKDHTHYKFVIGCRAAKGQLILSNPLTLKELAK